METNVFKLTEEYFKRVNLKPKARIPAATNIQAMSYEFSDFNEAVRATSELLAMILDYRLEWVEVYCQVREGDKHFVTIEELDPDEFEDEEE